MTHRIRTTLLALAAAALLIPTALAGSTSSSSPAKPTLQATKPGTKVTTALYLAALAGTATTSR